MFPADGKICTTTRNFTLNSVVGKQFSFLLCRIEDRAGKHWRVWKLRKFLEHSSLRYLYIHDLFYGFLFFFSAFVHPLALMMDLTTKPSAKNGASKPGPGNDSSGFKAKSSPSAASELVSASTTKKPGQPKMAARRPQNQLPVTPRLISKAARPSESQPPEVHQISSTESSPKDTTSELPSDWEAKVGMSARTLWSQYSDNKGMVPVNKGNRAADNVSVKIDDVDGFLSSTPIQAGPSAELQFGSAQLLSHPTMEAQGDTSENQDSEASADLIATLENENRALLDTIMELRNSNNHINEQRRKVGMAEYMYIHLQLLQLQRSITNFENRKISMDKLVNTFKQHLRELENIGNKFLEDIPENFGRTEFDEMFSGVKRESESIDLELEAPPAKKFRPTNSAYMAKGRQAQ
ncbi:uncharacterized protein EV420DRAFT_1746351 [Desarmillaria tabescens]|uniref:Uncharacterized protein n=1 Tax=Armillaria tabescens TaxID=1929756 RepID=A0AA39NAK0_ARMTA|nr:uncharacterized protein EV420DRAFT_1746351 [Desarmillaria tabescens]KAK0462092.1 hypothetical protein EV420DRAFT_1746351 [Desarmillaria tabescens]